VILSEGVEAAEVVPELVRCEISACGWRALLISQSTLRRRRRQANALWFPCVLLLWSAQIAAQSGDENQVAVVPLLENVTRLESWSFFTPPPVGGDPDYTLLGNRATLAMRAEGRRIAFNGAVRYAQLAGLPRDAIGPGPLGPGAIYFAAARNPAAYQVYFKAMSLRIKSLGGLSLEGGRMAYESGEGTPFAGRLLGNAEWTLFERSFDGIRGDYTHPRWRAHASFLMPTQGAFEESANPTIARVKVASASWTMRRVQVFAHNYRDTRPVRVRPDNSARLAAAADVDVRTLGGSFTHSVARLDIAAWGALQGGRWYGESHRALSGSAEAAYRWPSPWKLAAAGGVLYASGDDDGRDGRHHTFFPMLPTTRPDSFEGTFAQMNHRNIYARATLEPRQGLSLRAEVHRLSLITPRDRWYGGTGATALRGEYFGFSTRSALAATGLGTAFVAATNVSLMRYWSAGASLVLVRASDVVSRQFPGNWLRVLTIESRLRFTSR
jgi:hypothetical protein